MEKEWITTKEAAELSGYHPEYLRELIRTQRINGRKFGPVWQVDKQDLLAYLEQTWAVDDRRWGPRD